MPHLLAMLVRAFGGSAEAWFGLLQAAEREGEAAAYRNGREGEPRFIKVVLVHLRYADVAQDYFLNLCATDRTIPGIRALPAPAPDDPIRITGLWPPPAG